MSTNFLNRTGSDESTISLQSTPDDTPVLYDIAPYNISFIVELGEIVVAKKGIGLPYVSWKSKKGWNNKYKVEVAKDLSVTLIEVKGLKISQSNDSLPKQIAQPSAANGISQPGPSHHQQPAQQILQQSTESISTDSINQSLTNQVSSESIIPLSKEEESLLETYVEKNLRNSDEEDILASYKCIESSCSQTFMFTSEAVQHIFTHHKGWRLVWLTSAENETTDSEAEKVAKTVENEHSKTVENEHSNQHWIRDAQENFEEKIIGQMDHWRQVNIAHKMSENTLLLPSEEMAIIKAVNSYQSQFLGQNVRPTSEVCRQFAEILMIKLPTVFNKKETITSTILGEIKSTQRKGHGGMCQSLSQRISQTYYNNIIRPKVEKDSRDEDVPTKRRKRSKIVYGLNSQKCAAGNDISRDEVIKSELILNSIKDEDDFNEKIVKLDKIKPFLQSLILKMQPPAIKMEYPQLFGKDGSKVWAWYFSYLSDNIVNIQTQLNAEFKDRIEFLDVFLDKKYEEKSKPQYEAFIQKSDQAKARSLEEYGSDVFYIVYMLRQLSKVWRENPDDMLKVNWKDEILETTDAEKVLSPQPYIIALRRRTPNSEYPYSISFEVKMSDVILFPELTFPEAIASVLQVIFTFDFQYPLSATCSFEFLQRILCHFGSDSGGRNARKKESNKILLCKASLSDYLLEKGRAVKNQK